MSRLLHSILRWLVLVLITLLAFGLRTHELARRPMHADEANQAVKTGELLESGRYVFDARDHHGPTLYYAALPIAWLRGEHTLAELSETTVRLVPALAGVAAVLLLFVATQPLGVTTALLAAAFLAVSPPAVYYSRYFIQETLLVTFALAAFVAAQRWSQTGRTRWLVVAGICAGLMLATKETALLFLLAGIVVAVVARLIGRKRTSEKVGRVILNAPPSISAGAESGGLRISRPTLAAPFSTTSKTAGSTNVAAPAREASILSTVALASLVALLVAAALYSSFGTHPTGLRDALLAPFGGLQRAAGGATGHEKPWWYYARLFTWHESGGLVVQQVVCTTLALIGAVIAIKRPIPLLRGVALYTAIIAAVLSLTPYKTPWHTIHLVPGMAVLAATALTAVPRLGPGRIVAALFACSVLASLLGQTSRVAFARAADPRNPFAYVHSSPDVLKFRGLVEDALARGPDQPVRIISEEYWPLPWYLRGLPRIGYWSTPPADCDGALVIASASQAAAVRERLHGRYHESFLGLRPGFVCVVFSPEPAP